MLSMPGHTKGEAALLVKLAKMGPVLLSGDVVHFEDNLVTHGVPGFNENRADTLASMERLQAIAAGLNATLVSSTIPLISPACRPSLKAQNKATRLPLAQGRNCHRR